MTGKIWTVEEIMALGSTTDLVTAGSILGIGRTKSYQLMRSYQFPVPVLRHSRRCLVPVAPILELLGIPSPTTSGRP